MTMREDIKILVVKSNYEEKERRRRNKEIEGKLDP